MPLSEAHLSTNQARHHTSSLVCTTIEASKVTVDDMPAELQSKRNVS